MGEKELKAGGIGLGLLLLVAIIRRLGWWLAWEWAFAYFWDLVSILYQFRFAAYVVFLIFALLFWISMAKLARTYGGNRLGRIGAKVGVLAGVMNIMFYLLLDLDYFFRGAGINIYRAFFLYHSFWRYVPVFLLALTLVMVGIFFILNRELFSYRILWVATGVVFIAASGFEFIWSLRNLYTIPLLWVDVGEGLVFLAGLLGAVSFLTSKAVETKTGSNQKE